MIVLAIMFTWWTLSGLVIGMVLTMPYDVFVDHKFFTSVFGIIMGPMIWCILIVYWIMYIKDVTTHSFERQ